MGIMTVVTPKATVSDCATSSRQQDNYFCSGFPCCSVWLIFHSLVCKIKNLLMTSWGRLKDYISLAWLCRPSWVCCPSSQCSVLSWKVLDGPCGHDLTSQVLDVDMMIMSPWQHLRYCCVHSIPYATQFYCWRHAIAMALPNGCILNTP